MNIEELRNHCLMQPFCEEYFPFDESTLAFKVFDKIFALVSLDAEYPTVNLKCDPELAIQWREEYTEVKPGFHMNKKHWNTVDFIELNDKKILEMICHSYQCVVRKLPKSKQNLINGVK